MSKSALIVFMKKPIPGQVKTRLAKTIGDFAANEVYKLLLEKTKSTVAKCNLDVLIFYSPAIDEPDLWSSLNVHKQIQTAGNLGKKMKTAFESVFDASYEKAVIIGTDCYELSNFEIEDAFQQLDNHDIVFGPTNDGGYYLLGMKQIVSDLFHNKPWSTPEVLQYSILDCQKNNLSFHLTKSLVDIDDWNDLVMFPELKQKISD